MFLAEHEPKVSTSFVPHSDSALVSRHVQDRSAEDAESVCESELKAQIVAAAGSQLAGKIPKRLIIELNSNFLNARSVAEPDNTDQQANRERERPQKHSAPSRRHVLEQLAGDHQLRGDPRVRGKPSERDCIEDGSRDRHESAESDK